MATTTAIRRRRLLSQKGIGLPGDNEQILAVARRLRDAVHSPVLGGIAVYLHGFARSTVDLDLYTTDRTVTDVELRAAGAIWNAREREHVFESVRIHTVTPDDTQHVVERTSTIDGIRVVSLKDLVAIKLICGLNHADRAKDLADVQELIRRVPLDKRFAGKLPPKIRAEFKQLVDVVRAGEKARERGPRF